ncbi:hypothetical protein BDV96DRAFT_658536 [Lophiotrema nucula]|uniref:Histidine phosphatase superfamily n=1 Tax=Lophiotrema nucula TaxID=690887 RepID=A0A6A5ZC43_9PLEO|nr:hypothetical protein BDV96DRAFT_658536 [Lophiotrema nucula]
MAKGPAVVIIARHGARLDASDKTWHLTSPTPYDPPLTYGGWSQGKALGLRVASLLHARESEEEANTNGTNADVADVDFSKLDGDKAKSGTHGSAKRKRKHRIVIHSSPYLRCIQTSTAIAAGISQYQPPSTGANAPTKHAHFADEPNDTHTESPPARSSLTQSSLARHASIVEPIEDPKLQVFRNLHNGPERILLRIDAFLGEWLSPDYFEDITPPPNSTMMVAGAKADLLRREEYVEVQPTSRDSKGHFPGGWVKSNGSSAAPSRSSTQHDGFPTMGSLAQALPHRERASSQSSVASWSSRASGKGPSSLTTAHKVPDHIYDPPVPSYAVSPADPIPRGYMSHARDACIEVDFQWDSMRAPQEWGDGGEYGDEWSTMHKRFRRGLGGMMSWYGEYGIMAPKEKISGFTYKETNGHVPVLSHHTSDPGPEPDQSDDDEELVLILVTHGAGCNALLGAISAQPVLLDIGLASLSMAVRRGEPRRISVNGYNGLRQASLDAAVPEQYELKTLAAVDHLRPGVDPRKLSETKPQSPAIAPSPSLEYRRRFNSTATSSPIDSPFSIGQPYRPIVNSSLGSMRRSSTSGSSSSRFLGGDTGTSTPASSTSGLWGSKLRAPTPQETNPPDGRHSPGQDMVSAFAMHKPSVSSINTDVSPSTAPVKKEDDHSQENDDVPPLPSSLGASLSPFAAQGLWAPKQVGAVQGLWGSGNEVEREKGPKRRWTINQSDG